MNNPQIIVKNAPFKHFCMSIGAIPTSYKDSLDYYETLLWLIKYLEETIIPTVNNNGEAVSELQTLYTQLKDFVENYFANLDVQEEINNKLDEMVEDGTLENILNQFTNLEVIFPKFWAGSLYGDCTIIKYEGKVIVIDCYNTDWWSNIYSMLLDNGVSHIDYLIITHYHGDHFGNFYNLFNFNFIDENTQLFMPAETTTMGWNSIIATVKEFCTLHNLNYYVPYENEVVEVGTNTTLKFTNCNAEILDEIYNTSDIGRNQNNSSTVVLLENRYSKISFLGDCEKEAYDRLESINFFKGSVQLHKMGHHAIEASGNFNVLSTLSPKYAVATGNIGDFEKCAYINSYEGSVLASLGTLIYPVYMNKNYIKFISNGIDLYCENGTPYKVGDCTTSRNFTFYVDNSVNNYDFQDGSQTHPFKELMQAISSIPKFLTTDITINLADGTYGLPDVQEAATNLTKNGIKIISQNKRNIIINGNNSDKTKVKLNSTRISNSNVIFNHITFLADNYTALRCYDSNVTLKTCSIDSTNMSNYNGIETRCSNLYISYTNINNVKDAIYPQTSTIITYRLEYGNVSDKTIIDEKLDKNNIIDLDTRYTTNTDILSNLKHYSRNITPIILYSNSDIDFTKTRINFNTQFNNFDLLLITVDYNNNRKDSVLIFKPFVGKHKRITDILGGANNCTFKSTDLYVGSDYIEITQFINFLINYSDSSITNNYGTNTMSINSVIGIKFDELIDISELNINNE